MALRSGSDQQMIQPDALIDLVLREKEAIESASRLDFLMTEETLLARGIVLEGTLSKFGKKEWLFCCPENIARFRIGDKVKLSHGAAEATATVIDMRSNGRSLVLRVKRHPMNYKDVRWFLSPDDIDLTALILSALRRLKSGAPGWYFYRNIMGDTPPLCSACATNCDDAQRVFQELADESKIDLDESQRDALLKCLALPSAYALQGPPGTGKTLVLAFAAEALARQTKRVVIIAPTHQAVNNALSVIRRHFPRRKLLKVGDDLRRESLAEDIPCAMLNKNAGLARETFSGETIIGMTVLSGLYHLALRTSQVAPNVVILEEAGQLPLSQGAAIGLLGAGSILMFGDDIQMPPVFTVDVSEEPLAKSLFAAFREAYPDYVDMLNTSYRLNDQLCDVIGESFYRRPSNQRLRPSLTARGRRFPAAERHESDNPAIAEVFAPNQSFVWIPSDNDRSRDLNNEEAVCVSSILAAAIRAGVPPDSVAAVTPFRRQAARIRILLESALPSLKQLPIIDTVERVQGLTVELIVVSSCASEPDYISSIDEFFYSLNRLNVALSRARTKAICVASETVFEVVPRRYSALIAQTTWRKLRGQARVVREIGRIMRHTQTGISG